MVGHAFVFLIAGFEATAAVLLYLAYELAMSPEAQAKAHEEVVKAMKNKDGVLDYDTVKDMPYLDQCVKETMRLHTFAGVILRVCTKDYQFPGTSVSIKAGESLIIPTGGIHMDPAYYPEPEKFKPERFGPDSNIPHCAYLPFGDGPRICIAMRFALTEVKVCMARLLLKSKIEINAKTKLPIEVDPISFSGIPKNPLYFDFHKID